MKTLFVSLFLMLSSVSFGAVYNCTSNTPQESEFLGRTLKIECDLDSLANPKLVFLNGTKKVPLNQKATYLGPSFGDMYVRLSIPSTDGQTVEINAATRLFTETAQAPIFTVEGNKRSGFWVCRIED